MTLSLDDIRYFPLSEECPRGGFRSGKSEIDDWFRNDACRRHADFSTSACRVFTAHLPDKQEPIGFYTMSIILEDDRIIKGRNLLSNLARNRVFPAFHVEYLAVHEDCQKQGLGKEMMGRAITTFGQLARDTGLAVCTIVPLTDTLVEYYQKWGFERLSTTGERRMLLTAEQAIRALEAASRH